jgi:hypothetical protein
MAATVVGPPWTECTHAEEWDSISAQEYCDRIANPRFEFIFDQSLDRSKLPLAELDASSSFSFRL